MEVDKKEIIDEGTKNKDIVEKIDKSYREQQN